MRSSDYKGGQHCSKVTAALDGPACNGPIQRLARYSARDGSGGGPDPPPPAAAGSDALRGPLLAAAALLRKSEGNTEATAPRPY